MARHHPPGVESSCSPADAGRATPEDKAFLSHEHRLPMPRSRCNAGRPTRGRRIHAPSVVVRWIPLILLAFLSGCAAFRPAAPPLSDPETSRVLNRLKGQAENVLTFYSMGTVVLKQGFMGSQEARILVVGTRDPLRIKVEITHPWGRPLLHVLVSGDRLEALSFQEATRYTGPATPETLGRFLPSPPDLASVWSLLRGCPAPPERGTAISESGPRIVWRAASGKPLQILGIRAGTLEPERIVFPASRLQVLFGDLRERGGIRYAGEVRYLPEEKRGQVLIQNERMVFNQDIPEAIFEIRGPSSFRTEALDNGNP